jgi:hypothetical protein
MMNTNGNASESVANSPLSPQEEGTWNRVRNDSHFPVTLVADMPRNGNS